MKIPLPFKITVAVVTALLVGYCAKGAAVPLNVDETTTAITVRTNFFDANIDWLTGALEADGWSPGGGGGSASLDSNWMIRWGLSGTNNIALPPLPVIASGTSATPDANVTTEFVYTLTGAFTLNAISNVTTNHSAKGIEFTFIQNATGGFQVSFATNYLFNDTISSGTIVRTNAGYRSIAKFKPRRDQPAVYDCVGWIEGGQP